MRYDTIWLDARLATLDPVATGPWRRRARRRSPRPTAASPLPAPIERSAGRLGRAANAIKLDGRWMTPGLIDCHTHLVYGGDRAHEFELRLAGASLRGDRARRRRHPLDREGDARGERGRAGRRRAAAARPRCWPKASPPSRSSPATASTRRPRRKHAARGARGSARERDVDVADDLPRRPCAAAGSDGRRGRLHRRGLRHDPGARRRQASPTPSMPSARGSPSRRSRPRGSSPPRAPPACRSSCTPTNCPTCTARALAAELRRALGRSSRIHRRGRRRRDGAGRHGRRAAAGRVLHAARDASCRRSTRLRRHQRADRARHRLQSRHLAGHLAAADHEHGRDAVPPHRRRDVAGVTREAARALGRLADVGTLEPASTAISPSGISSGRPNWSIVSASTRCMRAVSPRRDRAEQGCKYGQPSRQQPQHPRAARHRAQRQELAHRSAAAHADEQSRPRGGREAARTRGLWRHRPRRARLGELTTASSPRCARSKPTRRCWCSPASRSASSAPTPMRRAC